MGVCGKPGRLGVSSFIVGGLGVSGGSDELGSFG